LLDFKFAVHEVKRVSFLEIPQLLLDCALGGKTAQFHLVVVQFASGGNQVLEHDDWRVVAKGESLGLEVGETQLGHVFPYFV
jgi:hypothetical protein